MTEKKIIDSICAPAIEAISRAIGGAFCDGLRILSTEHPEHVSRLLLEIVSEKDGPEDSEDLRARRRHWRGVILSLCRSYLQGEICIDSTIDRLKIAEILDLHEEAILSNRHILEQKTESIS